MFDAHLLAARVTVDKEQCVHARDHVDRGAILRIHLDRVDEFASRMRPPTHVHHLWPTDIVVGLIAVPCRTPSQLSRNYLGLSRPRPRLKLEHGFAAGRTVLPQVRLMIGAALIVHLHRHRRFVGL